MGGEQRKKQEGVICSFIYLFIQSVFSELQEGHWKPEVDQGDPTVGALKCHKDPQLDSCPGSSRGHRKGSHHPGGRAEVR